MAMLPIRYREFWDIPRSFIVLFNGSQYLFDCLFDDEQSEYPDTYRVYRLPCLSETALQGSWAHLPDIAVAFAGEIPVSSVKFDPSLRASIESDVFSQIFSRVESQVA